MRYYILDNIVPLKCDVNRRIFYVDPKITFSLFNYLDREFENGKRLDFINIYDDYDQMKEFNATKLMYFRNMAELELDIDEICKIGNKTELRYHVYADINLINQKYNP